MCLRSALPPALPSPPILCPPRLRVPSNCARFQPRRASPNKPRPRQVGSLVVVVHAAFLGVCGSPDNMPSRFTPDGKRRHFAVSRSMFETDNVGEENVHNCNLNFDAVWVPSHFNVRSFSRAGVQGARLRVLPEAFDPALYNCSLPRLRAPHLPRFGNDELDRFLAAGHDGTAAKAAGMHGEGEGAEATVLTFTFLSVFKWEERKNWQSLLRAFWTTFPRDAMPLTLANGTRVTARVRLLVKTSHLSWGTDPAEDVPALLGDERAQSVWRAAIGCLPPRGLPHAGRAFCPAPCRRPCGWARDRTRGRAGGRAGGRARGPRRLRRAPLWSLFSVFLCLVPVLAGAHAHTDGAHLDVRAWGGGSLSTLR